MTKLEAIFEFTLTKFLEEALFLKNVLCIFHCLSDTFYIYRSDGNILLKERLYFVESSLVSLIFLCTK